MRTEKQRYPREKQILLEFCQAQGMHHSEKRYAVLEAFLGTEKHVTAEELWERLERRGSGVDMKTVVSAMELLVKAGLAREFRLEDGIVRYEHVFAHRHHDHLICRRCNRMIEFASPAIEKLQDEVAATHRFVIEDHNLTIYGVCSNCTAKAHVAPPPHIPREERAQLMSLIKLKPGQRGTVREIAGGESVGRRLAAMGIRPGKQITKVSAILLGGPVVVSVNRRQLALGSSMAAKVFVAKS